MSHGFHTESGAGDRQFFWTQSQDFWRSDRNTFWTSSAPKLAQSGASDLGHPARSSKWTAESRVNGWHPLPKRSAAILPKSGADDRQFFWTQSQDFWRSDRNTFWTSSAPKLDIVGAIWSTSSAPKDLFSTQGFEEGNFESELEAARILKKKRSNFFKKIKIK